MEELVKVTHIIGGGEFGGAEEHLLLLLTQLKKEGISPRVICFYDALFAKRLRENGIPVDVLSFGRFDFRLYFGLVRLLKEQKPDIIHTHGVKANFFGRLAAKKVGLAPIVTTVHSLLRYDYIHPVARILATLLDKSTRGLTDQYIAISEKIKAQLETERIPANKIEVIHHGIQVAKFRQVSEEERDRLAQKWGKQKENVLVGAIGRLHKVKGFPYFVEACRKLHEEEAGRYRFVLVGDGPERKALEELVQEKGLADVFHFAGFREDVATCLHALDCYVSSSLSEGLGLAVLEALASGTPVVATGVGGVLDFARHEHNCLLVEPADSLALAHAIRRLVNDRSLAERLTRQAIIDVESKFSVEQMGAKTAHCYRKWRAKHAALQRRSNVSQS